MVSAGYHFIPVPKFTVAPPVGYRDLDISRPHKGGSLSGTLKVTWTAETPVCIGEAVPGEAGHVRPLKLGDRYILPGSSQRGMVRSVLEIATFSHAGRINGHRHFGRRNYTDDSYKAKVDLMDMKAGWLSYDTSKKEWRLTTAGTKGEFGYIEFKDILSRVNKDVALSDEISPVGWRGLSVHEKRLTLQNVGIGKPCQLNPVGKAYFRGGKNDTQPILGFGSVQVKDMDNKAMAGKRMRGYIIPGGPMMPQEEKNAKKFEAVIPEPITNGPRKSASWTITAEVMDVFNRINSTAGDGVPANNWRYWLNQFDWHSYFGPSSPDTPAKKSIEGQNLPGIPVFYVGDPAKAAATYPGSDSFNFYMGLSRVLKIPHDYSVGQLAKNLYGGGQVYEQPRMADKNGFDFARAMFGWVDGTDTDRAVKSDRGANTEDALKGRVAFDQAWVVEPPRGALESIKAVFGAPRESFFPFYLKDGDYDTMDARPAGRKRYPARLRAQLPVYKEPPNETQITQVEYLPAGTRFSGRIRFHNLHPVELGALLWALTFGKTDGRYRHAIGRGKAFGYGQLSAEVEFAGQPRVKNPEEASIEMGIESLMSRFEDYMSKRADLEGYPFTGRDEIIQLRRMADPEVGAGKGAQLAQMDLGEYSILRKDKHINALSEY